MRRDERAKAAERTVVQAEQHEGHGLQDQGSGGQGEDRGPLPGVRREEKADGDRAKKSPSRKGLDGRLSAGGTNLMVI